MKLKQALESLWRRPLFHEMHINIISSEKYGDLVHTDPDIWIARGRKVPVRCHNNGGRIEKRHRSVGPRK